jgi:hypothetical protein
MLTRGELLLLLLLALLSCLLTALLQCPPARSTSVTTLLACFT